MLNHIHEHGRIMGASWAEAEVEAIFLARNYLSWLVGGQSDDGLSSVIGMRWIAVATQGEYPNRLSTVTTVPNGSKLLARTPKCVLN